MTGLTLFQAKHSLILKNDYFEKLWKFFYTPQSTSFKPFQLEIEL